MKKNKILHILGIIISVVFIYLIFKNAKLNDLLNIIVNTNFFYSAIVAVLSLVLVIIKTIRWKLILNKSDSIPYIDLLKINFASHMFNVILPFRAGEVIQIFLTKTKTNTSKSNIAGSLVLNKFMELFSLLLVFFITILFIKTKVPSSWTNVLLYLLVFSLIFLVLFGFNIIPLNSIAEPKNKIMLSIYNFFLTLSHIKDKLLMFQTLLLSVFVWLIELLMIQILLSSFGIQAPLWAPVLLLVGINIAMLIPATSGSFGPYEYAIILVLGLLGVSKETGIAYAFTYHLLGVILTIVVGFLCYINIRGVRK